jgi:mycoredoxin
MSLFSKIKLLLSGGTKYNPESLSEYDEMPNISDEIIMYGTKWCYATKRAISIFDRYQVVYKYIDIDSDQQAAQYVESVNRGYRSVPTIVFADGSMLVEPSESELKKKLGVV